MMNEKKFCFIVCVNDTECLKECIGYINRLNIPDGYEIDLLTVNDACSMACGYEEARIETDAKYKIYIHQDTFIVNNNILYDLLEIFKEKDIALIGVLGSDSIIGNRVIKTTEIIGNVVSIRNSNLFTDDYEKKVCEEKYIDADCILGCFIASQIDFAWEDVIENDWKYYSVIHCLEAKKRGYRTVVAVQEEPWCIHDGNNDGLDYPKGILENIKEKYPGRLSDSFFRRVLICDSEVTYEAMRIALLRMGYSAEKYHNSVTSLRLDEEATEILYDWLSKNDYKFVFSYNFSPNVAEATKRLGIKYISWAWDAPLLSYVFEESRYDTSWTFMFDKTEIKRLKELGIPHVSYLPLATDVNFAKKLVITKEDENNYSHDISFIGQMYYTDILDSYAQKYDNQAVETINKILNEDLCDWSYPQKMHERIDCHIIDNFFKDKPKLNIEYYDKSYFDIMFFRNIAHSERVAILNELAKKFKVDIYTKGRTDELINVNIHEPVHSLLVAPKIFHLSKINLNITTRNIRTGVPLRIFDIMGVGGFVLTNYQEEISDLFEEDKEIVCFKTLEEMMDKAGYYLKHDSQREQIAQNGYKRVKRDYNYEVAISKILKEVENG